MTAEPASVRLKRALLHLISLEKEEDIACSHCQCGHSHKRRGQHLLNSDTWDQLEALRRILCELYPDNEIPPEIDEDIDEVIAYRNSHTLLTSTTSITTGSVTLQHPVIENANPFRLSSWNGDITTLTDVTAIVNAANSGLLGCFIPEHRCIDNVIHSAAGPHLRQACRLIMDWQTDPEPAGLARITPGFHLPASGVLHTVGPQLRHRETPQPHHKNQLASCYRSCLDAAEMLHPLPDQRKVVAFCCISTGLFAFPSDMAARIAVDTVRAWHLEHPMTSITDVIFNTYLEKDQKIYQDLLQSLQNTQSDEEDGSLTSTSITTSLPPLLPSLHTTGTIKARTWIEDADALIISAGAGLSAAAGLDYNSHDLFTKHFPAFRSKGLRRLYDVMGYNGWSSDAEKWGYYFLHLDMVRKWPVSPIYEKLRDLAARFPKKHFIRTSNADGLFVKNGFDRDIVATPQGQYRFLQCLDKCQPDAYVLSDPLVDAALPFIDFASQVLMDESKIPKCRLCGGEMTLCVRGGTYFNSKPFRDQEIAWKKFSQGLENEKDEKSSRLPKKIVVLELGVGLNTPGVLRWPNENLVSESPNKTFRLIRIGKEASGCVPWELEEEDLAVGVSGDVVAALDLIIPSI